ncbi:MAG: hypothetical protein IPO86_13325 [Saprospiraceae bacterium]|nr:hypothetical protein [Saprospiraceae bacterium]MBK9729087.1 hypothetical protein [Saprospiraceae bacterium]
MIYNVVASLCLILFFSCSSSKIAWTDLKASDCSKYAYGRIEAKRLLSEAEKSDLLLKGLHIQEFIFENQYLGSWELKKWPGKNLEKSAIQSLIKFMPQEKLASGMLLSDLSKLAESPGESMVLIQAISTIDLNELKQFGTLVFNRDHFYRMIVPHQQLISLLEFPCLRLLSIVKETYEPDVNRMDLKIDK